MQFIAVLKDVYVRELKYLMLVGGLALILAAMAYFIHQFSGKKLLEDQTEYLTQKSEFDRLSILTERVSCRDSLKGYTSTIDSLLLEMYALQILENGTKDFADESSIQGHHAHVWGDFPPKYRLSLLDSLEVYRKHLIDNLNRQSSLQKKENVIFKVFILLINASLLIFFPGRWACNWLKNQKSLK